MKVIPIGQAGEHICYRNGEHEETDGLVLNDLLTDLFGKIPCRMQDGRESRHIRPGGWHENCELYWSLADIEGFFRDLPYELSLSPGMGDEKQPQHVQPIGQEAVRLDVCVRLAYWLDTGHSLSREERVSLEGHFCELARNGADFDFIARKDGIYTQETLAVESCEQADLTDIQGWDDICLLYASPRPRRGSLDGRRYEISHPDNLDRRRVVHCRKTLQLEEAVDRAKQLCRATGNADLLRKSAGPQFTYIKLKGTYDAELLASSGDLEGWVGCVDFDGFVRLDPSQMDGLLTMNKASLGPFAFAGNGLFLRTDETFGTDRVLVDQQEFERWLNGDSDSIESKGKDEPKIPANQRHAAAIRDELAKLKIDEPLQSGIGKGISGLRSTLRPSKNEIRFGLTQSQFDAGWKLIKKEKRLG